MKKIVLCLFFFVFQYAVVAASGKSEDENLKELENPVVSKEEAVLPKNPALSVGKILTLGARFDTAFSGGGAINQGFSIPSYKLTAYGEAGSHVDYRMSAGQTREYSTSLLPALMPTEAYLDLTTVKESDGEADLRLRMGMTAPTLVPWWSPDLSDVVVPDYHETHKAILMARDIGAELTFRPAGEHLSLSLGAYNGSGILSLNTNNSKAFSSQIHLRFPMSKMVLGIGDGSFYSEQSVKGAINYKKTWATDAFAYIEIPDWRALVAFDYFISEYEDLSRSVSPTGFAVMGRAAVNAWLLAFARYETSTATANNGTIRNLQLGPIVEINEYVRAYGYFQALEENGGDERSLNIRMRVSL